MPSTAGTGKYAMAVSVVILCWQPCLAAQIVSNACKLLYSMCLLGPCLHEKANAWLAKLI